MHIVPYRAVWFENSMLASRVVSQPESQASLRDRLSETLRGKSISRRGLESWASSRSTERSLVNRENLGSMEDAWDIVPEQMSASCPRLFLGDNKEPDVVPRLPLAMLPVISPIMSAAEPLSHICSKDQLRGMTNMASVSIADTAETRHVERPTDDSNSNQV